MSSTEVIACGGHLLQGQLCSRSPSPSDYPLLRRLDEQGLLESDWNIEKGRPRKYCRLSARGTAVLASLREQWGRLVKVVDRMLDSDGAPSHSVPVN